MTLPAPAPAMRPDAWTREGESGLMARLVALQLVADQQLNAVTAAHGVTLADYLVLGVIRRSSGEVCAPSTVCDVLRRTSGGVTLTLDRLQSAGWVTREADPRDGRRVLLRLTPVGRDLAVAVNESLHEWEHAITGRQRLRAIVAAIDDLLDLLEPPATTG